MPIGCATTINTTPVQRPLFQDNTQPTVKGVRMGNESTKNQIAETRQQLSTKHAALKITQT